jgi:hypothetical protein
MKAYTDTYIYIVELDIDDEEYLAEYVVWCKETIDESNWFVDEDDLFRNTKIRFKNEADRNWFILRWSGEK